MSLGGDCAAIASPLSSGLCKELPAEGNHESSHYRVSEFATGVASTRDVSSATNPFPSDFLHEEALQAKTFGTDFFSA